MMTADAEWDDWTAAWQAGPAGASEALDDGLRAELRRARRMRWIQAAVLLAVLGGIGAALVHAPDPADVLRGGIVALLALSVAGLHWMRDRRDAVLAQPTRVFLSLAARGRRRELRAIGLVWALLALALAFLVPWWIDGYRIHGGGGDALALVSAWLPAALICWTFAWSIRRRADLRRELSALSRADGEWRAAE